MSSSETPASSNASISRTTCTAAGLNSPSSRCGPRMPSSSSRRTCSSEHGTSSAICSAEIPATTLTLASLRRPNDLDDLAHVEVAALVVRRCAREPRQAPLVQLAPAQRELEPLLVCLDEAPKTRCALGVAALGRDRRQPGDAVADEPVQARVPGDAEPLLVRVLGGVHRPRLELDVAERVERARRAEDVAVTPRKLGRLAHEPAPALEVPAVD